jgi:hypothetical protein
MSDVVEWKNGWKFTRKMTGEVCITVVDLKNPKKVIAETVVPETDWSVIIWKMSLANDVAIAKSLFRTLHCG